MKFLIPLGPDPESRKKSHSLLNIDQRESELIASHFYEPSGYLVTRSIDFMAKGKLGTSQ